MNNKTAKDLLDGMVGKKYQIADSIETFHRYTITDGDRVIIVTDQDSYDYDLNRLGTEIRAFVRFNHKSEQDTQPAVVQPTNQQVEPVAKKSTYPPYESSVVQIHREQQVAPITAFEANIEKMVSNPNIKMVEEALMAQIEKLKNGNKEDIAIANAMNSTATTILNIQKSKIEAIKAITQLKKL